MNSQHIGDRWFRASSLGLLMLTLALGSSGCGGESASGDTVVADSGVSDDAGIGDAQTSDGSIGDASAVLDAGIDASADAAVDADIDRSDEVYERSRLLEVIIDMDPGDLETLRVQRRAGLEIIAPECALPPAPYTWFSSTVTVDGEVFEDVGIRKKGFFGSVSVSKPSFKVKFDKYIDDQEFLDMKRLTLNNSRQDPSYVRQCLAYDIFRAAGIPAPRCNFAHVTLNGTDMGVYVNVESLKNPFVRRNFPNDDGSLYEGTLSDFRENWTGTIKQKTNESEPDTRAIEALTAALQQPDEQLLEALSEVIDLDQFLTFWATEIMVAHWDGYSGNTNNFHFYDDPTSGKLHFIPWGTDGTFVPPILFFEGRRPAPRSVNAASLLCRRLYLHPEGRRLYVERLSTLLDAHWDVEALQGSIEDMARVFGPGVPSNLLEGVWAGLSEVISFLGDQETRIRQELETGPVEWNVGLRDSLCQEQAGAAQGRFETTWGSWPAENTFETGNGMVSMTLYGEGLDIQSVGAAVGRNEEDRRAAQMIIPLLLRDDQLYFFSFTVPADQVVDGAEFDFSAPQNNCSFNRFDPRTRRVDGVGSCQSGVLVIERGSTQAGSPIQARFDVGIWARRR